MKDYTGERIRNVCLMSHGGAGKTTLAEAMLYNTGVLDRLGKVVDGNTTTDFDPEEIKRKISISTAIAPCEWKDHKINVIDTPGYFDFVGEVKQGIRVADSAIILVSAKSGVAVGTEKSWAYAGEHKLPVVFFINKMDEENADFFKVVDQLINTFGKKVIPFQVPIIEGEKFTGFVDIITMSAKKFDKDKLVDTAIPADLDNKVAEIRGVLAEAIAETDEELMEKFFADEEFTPEDINRGICSGVADGSIVPVLCGSAANNLGVQPLMDMIIGCLPSAAAAQTVKGKLPESDKVVEFKTAPDAPLSALVFKTIADPFVGKISLFRVYSGTLKSDSVVFNSTTQKTEKIGSLFIMRGKKQIPTDKLVAGDIGGISKLQNTNTNDTLCEQAKPIVLDKIEYPEPSISLAVEPKAKGDEEKISAGLQKLQDEDLTFKVTTNTETKQTLISGIGEQHLDVITSKLKSKFGVSVNLTDPKVPYRETIKKKVKVEGKHKKQSGGHGQYGHVWIEFEPGETEDLTFEEKIFGGAVPKQYHPAVEKGLREAIQHGVLAGYPVVNLKATLVDGSYHDVDSSEMAFKIAAKLAYKKGLAEASPVLLEPIAHVEVYVPDSYMGDVIGDLNKRRGRILGMNPQEGGIQQVVAEVPQAEMFKYATELRSMTQGRGYFKLWFERYEEAPAMISQKVIEEAKRNMAEDNTDE
ncbi:elongation factor G [Pseudoclostridium thermosuccinogenes]|uniref:elongation factor G n=1 Tax=Clostridium thermosuccinogenes TaxID=84032 RepID=UPI000CCC6096|nr:elongation factor G [Pseudoclostridium thermosuccinogenes]PNT90420.1 elongation factor G [Pseudoclostridium thermosuccinogenes]